MYYNCTRDTHQLLNPPLLIPPFVNSRWYFSPISQEVVISLIIMMMITIIVVVIIVVAIKNKKSSTRGSVYMVYLSGRVSDRWCWTLPTMITIVITTTQIVVAIGRGSQVATGLTVFRPRFFTCSDPPAERCPTLVGIFRGPLFRGPLIISLCILI